MQPINRNPTPPELRSFARIWFPLFVLALGTLVWWRFDARATAITVWAAGALVAAAALASVRVARAVFVGLLSATYPVGLVVSTIVLALLFFAVFTPFGVLMRVAGRDPLRLRARGAASHWIGYRQNDDPRRLIRHF